LIGLENKEIEKCWSVIVKDIDKKYNNKTFSKVVKIEVSEDAKLFTCYDTKAIRIYDVAKEEQLKAFYVTYDVTWMKMSKNNKLLLVVCGYCDIYLFDVDTRNCALKTSARETFDGLGFLDDGNWFYLFTDCCLFLGNREDVTFFITNNRIYCSHDDKPYQDNWHVYQEWRMHKKRTINQVLSFKNYTILIVETFENNDTMMRVTREKLHLDTEDTDENPRCPTIVIKLDVLIDNNISLVSIIQDENNSNVFYMKVIPNNKESNAYNITLDFSNGTVSGNMRFFSDSE